MLKQLCMAVALLSLIGCTTKDNLKTLLKENPEILIEAIEAHPEEIAGAFQSGMEKSRQAKAEKAIQEAIDKPLKPEIRSDETIRGPKDAPLTLVIYSDFECPYCARGSANEKALAEKYKEKIRVIFKHLPLPSHPNAMIAAQYYEGVRMQSGEKAHEFHDKIFANQQGLQKGETFLKATAKSVGADMSKLAKDIQSDAVKSRISADVEEARTFGFQGTPGYLINGVPVYGAYPVEHFDQIIEKLKASNKVTL